MSLVQCPECGHEVATNAFACPNCGRPLVAAPPVTERKVVVVDPPLESGFPTWALIPIGLLAVILIAVLFLVFHRNPDDANSNIRVNVNGSRPVTRTDVPSTTTTVPSTTAPSTTTAPPSMPTTQTTVPGSQTTVTEPTKGRVTIEAKVITANGGTQVVRNAKFYLLDKDLETILSNARVEPIDGQSLSGSLGLSIVFPDRYGDFYRQAMSAINKHVKYGGTTNGSGSAALASVDPNSYYLFAITKIGRGFSLWNSPVSVQVGDNVLTLSPQSVTEIQSPQG